MAWAFDAESKTERFDPPDNGEVDQTHVCTGSDRLLTAAWGHYNPAGITPILPTYNGTNMEESATSPVNAEIEWGLFYLANPDTGSNTLQFDYTGNPTQFYAHAVSYTGIDQTPTIEDTDATTGSGVTSLDLTLTGLTTGSLIVGVFGGSAGNVSADTGTTERAATTNDQSVMGDVSAAAASDTIDFSSTTSSNYNILAMAFAEAGAAKATPISNLALLGVG